MSTLARRAPWPGRAATAATATTATTAVCHPKLLRIGGGQSVDSNGPSMRPRDTSFRR